MKEYFLMTLLSLDYCLDYDKYKRYHDCPLYRSNDLPYSLSNKRYKAIENVLKDIPSFGLLYFSIYSLDNINPKIYKSILDKLQTIPETTLALLCNLDMDNSIYRYRLIYYAILDITFIKERHISSDTLIECYRYLSNGLLKGRRGKYRIDTNIARDAQGDPLEIDKDNRDIALYYLSDLSRVYIDKDEYFRIITEK